MASEVKKRDNVRSSTKERVEKGAESGRMFSTYEWVRRVKGKVRDVRS